MSSASTLTSQPAAAVQPPKLCDVSVVGGGPAGLMASLCLTTYGLNVAHFDNRSEPTVAGRADGIQPRTLEVLTNIGGVDLVDEPGDVATGRPPFHGGSLADTMMAQGVRVYEVAFWDPTERQQLARTSRAPSCPDFVDVVHNYTLLLHQGRIERSFLNEIAVRRRRLSKPSPAPTDGCFRPYEVESCRTLPHDHDDLASSHPCELRVKNLGSGVSHFIRSKYILGCDGARSIVRTSIAGGQPGDGEQQGKIRMIGEGTDIIWGVMDAQITTDFPDVKYKCLIHSRSEGSIMIIPRENSLVRFYVQLQASEAGEATHITRQQATQDYCIERAKKIMAPYQMEVGYVDWYSQYAIGQRIASSYSLDHRIFLGGDATHTHSPKAGQGMNISMLDMYSLAWKINLVEKGIGRRDVLLPSYEHERRHVAEELLKFDAAYSRLFSGRNPTAEQLTEEQQHAKKVGAVDAQQFIEAFKANARFTSGCGAVYPANELNMLPDAPLTQDGDLKGVFNPVGCNLVAGERLTPAMVVRVDDANQVHLQQEVKMNGAFRIHVLAGDLNRTMGALKSFASHLESPHSFLMRHQPASTVRASIVDGHRLESHLPQPALNSHEINPFFTFLTIVGTHYYDWEMTELPALFVRNAKQVYCDCVYDRRVHEAGTRMPLHRKYGIDVQKGAILIVRPDGYVGAVVSLEEPGWKALDRYFAAFLQPTAAGRGKL